MRKSKQINLIQQVCVFAFAFLCMCVRVCACVCVYMFVVCAFCCNCTCIKYIHTHGHAHIQDHTTLRILEEKKQLLLEDVWDRCRLRHTENQQGYDQTLAVISGFGAILSEQAGVCMCA